MHHFVIIADDFTGANDTGVQLCKRGIPADVILDIDQIEDNGNSLAIEVKAASYRLKRLMIEFIMP